MIEVLGIQIHQLRIIAPMFCVTDSAIFGFILVESAIG
jgi:hypothetical protein